tara:strand:- start:638 stop:1360 length:723 start_codon:yes stop_codon:yes gene_type:complete
MPPKRGPPPIKRKPIKTKRRRIRRTKTPLKLDRSLSNASAEVQRIMAAAINTNYNNSPGLQVEYGDNETLFRPIPKSLSPPLSPLESVKDVKFGGRRKRKTRKKRGGDYIEFDDLKDGKTYDVTFSDEFIEDNEPMSKSLTNVLFKTMDDQPDWFKLSFIHQEDGEKEEHVLYKKDEYGMDGIVYVTRESGSRSDVSADAGGRRKTKKKTRKKRKRKTKKKRKYRKKKKKSKKNRKSRNL